MSYTPPFEKDSEVYLLAGMIAVNGFIDECQDLSEDMFYDPMNKVLAKACFEMKVKGQSIDLVTINKHLKDKNLSSPELFDYVLYVTRMVGAMAHSKEHKAIIKDVYVRRSMIDAGLDLAKSMYERGESSQSAINEVLYKISKANDALIEGGELDTQSVIDKVVNKVEALASGEMKLGGVETGSPKLDQITGGWQKTDLIILAGRPGMAKTTRALNFAKSAALGGKKVAVFSLEMGADQLIMKMISEQGSILIKNMRQGALNQYDLENFRKASHEISKLGIFMDDKSAVSPTHIRSRCQKIKRNSGLDLVIIDYVQLCRPSVKKESRDAEVGSITQELKGMAKDLEVPVMALSQLSRKCEERNDKRPILSDLRESGSIEQDADMVLGIYRPSYYHELDKDRDYNQSMTDMDEYKRVSELHVLKHRNGESNVFVGEYFYGEYSRFTSQYGQHSVINKEAASNYVPPF